MATIAQQNQDPAEAAKRAAEQAERQRQLQAQTQAQSQKLNIFGSEKKSQTWGEELEARCKAQRYGPPIYNITSDRRGGRTAWSSTVVVQGVQFAAKYWYDGQHVNNAKEDAAAVACGVPH